jgi:glycosyltransferase involved in cell wall biosynthesis
MQPFFTIISVSYKDVWSLTKTARSVFRQTFDDFEYVVVDGSSTDGTSELIEFWKSNGLIDRALIESDSGVYNAMNKALHLAKGVYVCFLNAGDVFSTDHILSKLHEALESKELDGVLGWGELGGNIWASWVECEAFKMASLGFCHQSLFVKRDLLINQLFDERPFKTDSDTLQLSRLYESNAKISILPEVLAIRGAEPGISANLGRTKISIINTLIEEYPELDEISAEKVLTFRRQCVDLSFIIKLFDSASQKLRLHLGIMVLDTLFLNQSGNLNEGDVSRLYDISVQALRDHGGLALTHKYINQLLSANALKRTLIESNANARRILTKEVSEFRHQENSRIAKLVSSRLPVDKQARKFVVSLTSFPARIKTIDLVLQSLFEQTCPPPEIHLWLGADEIRSRAFLPSQLLKYEKFGLRVHFVPKTFHQYDKFMHNSNLNKETAFVIVDDDVIYPPTSMESLLNAHRAYPNAVIANRCHRIGITAEGDIEPYNLWPREIQVLVPDLCAIPTGAGGVLYPPNFLNNPLVTDVQSILAHAPYADDIWLKVCALARGIPTMTTTLSHGSSWYVRYTPTMKAGALHATNVDHGLNDLQIQRCFQWLSRVRPHWRDELRATTSSGSP